MALLLMAQAAPLAALFPNGEVQRFAPARLDCDLVITSESRAYRRQAARETIIFIDGGIPAGNAQNVLLLRTLDDGRSWVSTGRASARPTDPVQVSLTVNDLTSIQSDATKGVVIYNQIDQLTDGAGSVFTKGICKATVRQSQ